MALIYTNQSKILTKEEIQKLRDEVGYEVTNYGRFSIFDDTDDTDDIDYNRTGGLKIHGGIGDYYKSIHSSINCGVEKVWKLLELPEIHGFIDQETSAYIKEAVCAVIKVLITNGKK